jgi:hypothetical protein
MGAAALRTLPPKTLPARDDESRARLYAAASRAAPALLARDRLLPVGPPFDALLPGGGVRRGSTVALDGPPGAGATTVACMLAAAATATGEWAAVVDPDRTFGARAAHDAGVALERCAVVRAVPSERWLTVVAALLDGVALVVAVPPPSLRVGDARRLVARARERASVLVALGPWPVEAALRLHARGCEWRGLARGSGLLTGRDLDLEIETKGMRRGFARAGRADGAEPQTA